MVLALLPAMRLGLDLVLHRPLSPEFAANIDRFMEIFSGWFQDFKRTSLVGERTLSERPRKAQRIGTFFTGGVDSFYTLLLHESEITDLVYVHGFDVSLDDSIRRKTVSDMIRDVAQTLNKRFVEVETNARRLLKGHTEWGRHAHGAALACIANVISAEFTKMYIPSSFHHGALFPWGSHPDMDPLLAKPGMCIVHDGCDKHRTEKIEYISRSRVAMDHMRVCYSNVEGMYNCGRCEKCLRTMITLFALNKLEECRTFPNTIDPVVLKNSLFATHSERQFVRENIDLLDTRSLQGSDLYAHLQKTATRPQWLTRLMVFYRKRQRKLRRFIGAT
jgi:hypothetical protein